MSSFSKNIIKATIPQLDVSVITNGIDINRFKIFPKNKKKINGVRLLTIGSLTERKGQKNIINALPLLKKILIMFFIKWLEHLYCLMNMKT